jgi:hypothetical protein
MAELAARRAEAALDTEIKTQLAKSEQIKVSHAAYRKVCQQQKYNLSLKPRCKRLLLPRSHFTSLRG